MNPILPADPSTEERAEAAELLEFARYVLDFALWDNPLWGASLFFDGPWIVISPPGGAVVLEHMTFLASLSPVVNSIEAVFRPTPTPGVYLRFRTRPRWPAQGTPP